MVPTRGSAIAGAGGTQFGSPSTPQLVAATPSSASEALTTDPRATREVITLMFHSRRQLLRIARAMDGCSPGLEKKPPVVICSRRRTITAWSLSARGAQRDTSGTRGCLVAYWKRFHNSQRQLRNENTAARRP
jgi:hypothetical protein